MGLFDVAKLSFEFSSKLGVRELPEFDARHASNIPGVYVVGDLADAPIIKAALNQGYEVAAALPPPAATDDGVLDVVIVGAGPAGIGAALACLDRGLRYVVIEREKPFATIQNFPKAKLIFSEPREMPNKGGLWFEDARKEDLVDRWGQALDDRRLLVHQPEEVVDVKKEGGVFVVRGKVGPSGLLPRTAPDPTTAAEAAGADNTYRARAVILAIGRRAAVRRLECPGEELDKVAYTLRDPDDHRGRRVLVVGGGDSAIEAACETADAGATVTLSYRGSDFSRCKAKNRERIDGLIRLGKVKAELGTVVREIHPERVVLDRAGTRFDVGNDDVLVFIGTQLPRPFLERIGLRMNGQMDARRALFIGLFALATYLFYVLKAHKYEADRGGFFPFGPGDLLGFVPELLKAHVPLGKHFAERVVDAGFWGTVIYSVLITGFGIAAYRKYPSDVQKKRYLSLIGFQLVFLFGIPELLAPLVIDRPWKVYAATVPWPLSIWSLVDAPSWAGGSFWSAAGWLAVGAFVSFVALPLYIRKNGERFCSWMCGCGGLAETLGDQWRHLAPRGSTAVSAEWGGRIVLAAAVPVTLLILNDAWGFVAKDALYSTKAFAESWYGLMVDFWLASVVGVAFYPYLGNRVWCRFFCPLRAYMEIVAKYVSKIQIVANEKCIGCGECTRFCQMGIDVQKFAQRQTDMHNGNSACIQCGICIEVCPMDVLSLDRERVPGT
jgi:NosR/NirI family nitrous oxide reductase transcriptional regulator